jgi:glycosyltransferase involved in cell wall biosynthesis
MSYKKILTIIIPCYNEIATIEKIINKIREQKISKQIILVDDYSIDGTKELIKKKLYKKIDKVIFHKKNFGKGACIKSAIKYSVGKIILIQDADLEYSPKDYVKLIKPILKKKTNVVYGSRVLKKQRYTNNNFSSVFRVFANHILTICSNLINDQKLTDAHTCYKVLKKEIFDKIKLEEKGFSFCPELTTKISLLNENILEVPIRYKGRSYKEGKKISIIDGLRAVYCLIKYNVLVPH